MRCSFLKPLLVFTIGILCGQYLFSFRTYEKQVISSNKFLQLSTLQQQETHSCPCSFSTTGAGAKVQLELSSGKTQLHESHNSISSFTGRFFNCSDKLPLKYIAQNGDYYVSYNHVPASELFHCDETITYTTHAELNYLHNLIPLLPRWKGPVSVALYTPGSDYYKALETIRYLRECSEASAYIKSLVSFHLYFHRDHIPESFESIPWDRFLLQSFDCGSVSAKSLFKSSHLSYRQQENLTYPINVGRNIAKDEAATYFVLPSDVELYPSADIIPRFLNMLLKEPELIPTGDKWNHVFVLPVFEVSEKVKVEDLPLTKKALKRFYRVRQAQFFHKHICEPCHVFPKHRKWLGSRPFVDEDRFSVFLSVKRSHPSWEPFYIGLKNVPFWDERLTWRQRNKIAQASVMCLQNYTFNILDEAFLVHRPGIKTIDPDSMEREMPDTIEFFQSVLEPEMYSLFGENTQCFLPRQEKSTSFDDKVTSSYIS